MKKILFLINTLENGGAERVLMDAVNNLNGNLYDITLQTVFDIGSKKEDLKPNIQYKTIVKKGLLFKLKMFIFTKVLSPKYIYRKYIKSNYDIEVAFIEGLSTKLIAAAEDASHRIAWVHTDFLKYFESVHVYRSYKKNKSAYENFDKIVCVSNAVADSFIKRFDWKNDNVKVVNNAIDRKKIVEYAKANTDIPQKKMELRIVSCGRLVYQKGYDRLLRIHKRLMEEGLCHQLWIVGEGPERENLLRYVRDNQLDYSVTFFGYQKNPYPYIANADLFVCSSYTEGYSTVVTEAYLLQVPILTTEVAGAREPEECPRYSVICNNDETALYLSLKKILQQPNVLIEYKNKIKADSHYFDTESQIPFIMELLEK